MVYTAYKKQRILYLREKGCKAPTIARMLREEGLPCSRVGVAKFVKKFEQTEERTVSFLRLARCQLNLLAWSRVSLSF